MEETVFFQLSHKVFDYCAFALRRRYAVRGVVMMPLLRNASARVVERVVPKTTAPPRRARL